MKTGNIWFPGRCSKGQRSGFNLGPLLMDIRGQNPQDAISHSGCHVGSCMRQWTRVTLFNPQPPLTGEETASEAPPLVSSEPETD